MSTGFYNAAGQDFTDLFEPEVAGNGASVAGFFMPGNGPLIRFAARQHGQKIANVGHYAENGQDVSNFWAGKGTVAYITPLPINGSSYDASTVALSNFMGTVSAQIRFEVAANGTWRVVRHTVNSNSSGQEVTLAQGTWPSQGVVGEYEVRMRTTNFVQDGGPGQGGVTLTNSTGESWVRNTSLGCTIRATTPGSNGRERYGSVRMLFDIRRVGQSAILATTSINASVFVHSFQ